MKASRMEEIMRTGEKREEKNNREKSMKLKADSSIIKLRELQQD